MCTRSSSRLLVVLVLLAAVVAAAETVVFQNGQRAIGVRDVQIRDGFVDFTYRGKSHHVELIRVASVYADEEAPFCRIIKFRRYEYKRKQGWVLHLAFVQDEERIREPLVRVFTLEQDARGERAVKLYTNIRIEDPTRTAGLDMINASIYARRAWFLQTDELIAWRIEVWGDGKLRLLQEENQVADLAPDWWQTAAIRRADKLDPIELEPDEKVRPEDEVPPVDCQIHTARFHQRVDAKAVEFTADYQVLSKAVDEVDLPTAALYYVTEDTDKARTILNHTWRARPVKLVDGQFSGALECNLPDDVGLTVGGLSRNAKTRRVIFWRLEMRYGDTVVAVKKSPDERVEQSLPDRWWE